MKKLIRIGLLLAALMGPAAHAAVDAEAAEAMMKRSGLWDQMATLGPQARQGLTAALGRSAQRPTEAEVDRLVRAAEAAFDTDRLRGTARQVIAAGLDPAHLVALQAWYASPTGLGLRRVEEAAARNQDDSQRIVRTGIELLQRMAEDRRALLTEMVEVTQAAEAMVELVMGTTVAMVRGAASVAPPGTPAPSTGELRRALEAQRPQMLQLYRMVMLASTAVTYGPVAVGELAAYVDFLRSDAGRHYNALVIQALVEAVSEASAEMGRRLPGAMDRANT